MAIQIFEESPRRDLFTWTSIICGLAMHGHGKKALCYFSEMNESQVSPDEVTMVGVLSDCAHAGLIEQGRRHFQSMEKVFGLVPKIEHYGCMVDLLGRLGCLKEAYDLIMGMPMEANEIIWGSFLSACRVYNNVELGEVAARRLLELDPRDPWGRVMLSNIYAEEAKYDRSMGLRKEIKEKGLKKSPGCSSIEVNGSVHGFLVEDNSHPCYNEINSMLEKIEKLMKHIVVFNPM